MPDWFSRIAGFQEGDYRSTQARLRVRDGRLVTEQSAHAWSVGTLEVASLGDLRRRAAPPGAGAAPTRVRCVAGDVRALHADDRHAGAFFQVASQFNLLEMTGPDVVPEDGVTGYAFDRTQGPACAMAAGAATIYRNYLVPLAHGLGQRRDAQIDTLAGLGELLGNRDGSRWEMRNGYALCSAAGLRAIDARLAAADEAERDRLRASVQVGLHRDVDVTDRPAPGHRVTQVFCSALPVAYQAHGARHWERFATLVLEAAYEATLRAAALDRPGAGMRTVFLTQLGGGAFGNDPAWIHAAMRRAIGLAGDWGLDIVLVAYRSVPAELAALAREFAPPAAGG